MKLRLKVERFIDLTNIEPKEILFCHIIIKYLLIIY